jgi:hypothetical protein
MFVLRAKILNKEEIVNRETATVLSFFKIHKITKTMSTTSATNNANADIEFVRKNFDSKSTMVEFVAFMKEESTISLYNNNQAFRLVLIKEAGNIAEANYVGRTQPYEQLMSTIRELKTIESLWIIKQTYEREKNTVDGYEKV